MVEKTAEEIIKEAKKSVKFHLTFLEALLVHLKQKKEPALSHAVITSWCLHEYIHTKLKDDIKKAYENMEVFMNEIGIENEQ